MGRRGLIAGSSISGLLLLAAVTGVAKAHEPDGELIRMCNEAVKDHAASLKIERKSVLRLRGFAAADSDDYGGVLWRYGFALFVLEAMPIQCAVHKAFGVLQDGRLRFCDCVGWRCVVRAHCLDIGLAR